jgi:hypothetical protein
MGGAVRVSVRPMRLRVRCQLPSSRLAASAPFICQSLCPLWLSAHCTVRRVRHVNCSPPPSPVGTGSAVRAAVGLCGAVRSLPRHSSSFVTCHVMSCQWVFVSVSEGPCQSVSRTLPPCAVVCRRATQTGTRAVGRAGGTLCLPSPARSRGPCLCSEFVCPVPRRAGNPFARSLSRVHVQSGL